MIAAASVEDSPAITPQPVTRAEPVGMLVATVSVQTTAPVEQRYKVNVTSDALELTVMTPRYQTFSVMVYVLPVFVSVELLRQCPLRTPPDPTNSMASTDAVWMAVLSMNPILNEAVALVVVLSSQNTKVLSQYEVFSLLMAPACGFSRYRFLNKQHL